jgi:hypothetical protein
MKIDSLEQMLLALDITSCTITISRNRHNCVLSSRGISSYVGEGASMEDAILRATYKREKDRHQFRPNYAVIPNDEF